MVIGNGFFSDTEQDALREMTERSRCEVRRCVFPTASKIVYYISRRGDIYGTQMVQGKRLTRTKKAAEGGHWKRKNGGLTARMQSGSKREQYLPLEWLTYCTFTLKRWEPLPLPLTFINGNPKDVRPENLRLPEKQIPPGWSEHMKDYSEIYQHDFNRVCESVKWWCGIDKEDAKDIVQNTFVWLMTDGYREQFNVAIWTYWSRKRGLDFIYRWALKYAELNEDTHPGSMGVRCEIDIFHLQKGEKRARYLELWAQGHTPTEIAEMTGSTCGNVGSSVTRSIQFLQKYFRHEKELLRT